jgi:hypothetical protein
MVLAFAVHATAQITPKQLFDFAGAETAKFNGYVGFNCDLTPHLKPVGQTNVVAVAAGVWRTRRA